MPYVPGPPWCRLLLAVLLALWGLGRPDPAGAQTAAPPADNGAVVVMYHRFGEARYAATNIRLEQFDAHLEELTSGGYNVMALTEIVEALVRDRALPPRALAITIDDAFLSVYTEAWPRLRKAGLPFTLFVASEPIDDGLRGYMSWAQLREMAASEAVTIGAHSHSHDHMLAHPAARNRADIARGMARLEQELGIVPKVFAYPFGEYGLALRDLVAGSDFQAAFGQHSGAIARTTDRYALPRFPLNETYGSLERFRLVANALPLPVLEVTPADPMLNAGNNPPAYGFTVTDSLGGAESVACYAGGQTLPVERLGSRRIEVRVPAPFPAGRSRINCTMAGPDGRWRWLGRQFYVPPG